MTDSDINASADGILTYLQSIAEPKEAISILICTLLKFYTTAKNPEISFTIEDFVKALTVDLLAVYSTKQDQSRTLQ
jgi:hypothetical protein